MVDEKDINEYNERLARIYKLEGLEFPRIHIFRDSQYTISVNLNNCIEYYLARKFGAEFGGIITMLCKVAGVDVLHSGQLIAWNSIMHHFYKKLDPVSKYGEFGYASRAERIIFTTLLEVIESLEKL